MTENAIYDAHVTAEKDKEVEMMNEMKVEPLGLDDMLPCVVYLPPSLCLGLGTTVRTLLTALAQRRRWVEEGKLRGDLIQVPLDPTEKLAKIRGELAKKDAEIERMRTEIERLSQELEIWKSVFPDIAPERVLPDRSKLEARLANLEAVAEAARDLSEAFSDDLCRRDHHGYCQSHFLEEDCSKGSRVERLLKALSALDGEKEARAAVTAMKGERDDDAAQDAGGHTGMSESRHQGRVR